ncbi:MAG: FAD-binding oxidoreductase [Tepidiformaceae bacterium]
MSEQIPPDPLVATLRAISGERHVLIDADSRASYETDWTRRYHGSARMVVRPGSTGEVAAVLRACEAAGAAVVPQGGNTGLVGGGVPRGGEVVLSLLRLAGLEAVDPTSGQVTVGAGVTLAQLQEHVRDAGLSFGVDLASRGSATIGGMIATNAGGIHVLRYGGMRAQIVGIEAVRADGTVLRRLPGLTKDNTGYDLPGLIAGSEGTLAVVTAARLKLVRQQPHRAVALLAVADVAGALELLGRVRPLASLDAAELFFREGVELVCKHAGLPLPFGSDHACYVLVECAAAQDPLPELGAALDGAVFEDSALAGDRPGRDALWAYRERHTEAINAEGVPHKLDVALPLARLQEFAEGVRPRLAKDVPEARPILFGHAADGNLHVNVLGLAADDDRATDTILRYVASLGGSISAEHGIGVAKTRWLHLTRSPEEIATMAAVKAAFDPSRVLNPGVIFGT